MLCWFGGYVTQYHGGTNFGRTAGGPFITTSYDYDAPIDEYGENLKCLLINKSSGELLELIKINKHNRFD